MRPHKHFAKTYIDDIVIFSKSLEKHLNHLRQVFEVFFKNIVFINSKKTFVDYFVVNHSKQHVNFLKLVTKKQKLKAIANFVFSVTFDQLKIYLD